MAKHLQTEIDNLKKKILALGGVVEENLRQAVKSVVARDMKLANEVIEKDAQIDQAEVELEEDCLKRRHGRRGGRTR
jgi:phosphate transport system protein